VFQLSWVYYSLEYYRTFSVVPNSRSTETHAFIIEISEAIRLNVRWECITGLRVKKSAVEPKDPPN
jgi:hypothetical protein